MHTLAGWLAGWPAASQKSPSSYLEIGATTIAMQADDDYQMY
jgi:hypothetical protein